MEYIFIGESDERIRNLDRKERRKLYREAALQSYRLVKTWFGLGLFIIFISFDEQISTAIYVFLDKDRFARDEFMKWADFFLFWAGFISLGCFQRAAIRDALTRILAQKRDTKTLHPTAGNASV